MTPDCELLRCYAETRSDSAFAELVQRHLNLVYSAALRQVHGNAHLAQDVAQSVFTDLARKAGSLSRRAVLTGWLYTSVHFAAAKAVRSEQRRSTHEWEASTMRELLHDPEPEPDWDQLRPVLDAAMHELKDIDREALLLRYFENRQFAEVGAQLGLSENAARTRVDRALGKLRTVLTHRGIATAAAALSTVIAANAVQVAPAGLAASLTTASLAGAATGTATTLTLLKVMTMTKFQAGIVGAIVVAGVVTPLAIHHHAKVELDKRDLALHQQADRITQLEAENARLTTLAARTRSTSSPRLPAPRMQSSAPPADSSVDDSVATNLISQVLQGKPAPRLTAEQVGPYLQANRRNAASLLAAFRTTGDPVYLEEAMQRFPSDPQVAFEAAFRKDVSPQEQRQWLDALKQTAPQNSLADYLSAANHFKAGQPDQAVRDLVAASGKPQFEDYTLERIQDDEEIFRAAGYTVAESKTIPTSQLLLPQLLPLKQLTGQLLDLARSYQQVGDAASAQSVLQMAAGLGQRYSVLSAGEPEISQLVGIAIERMALNTMDPNRAYGSGGQTVQARLDQLAQQAAQVKELAQQTEGLLSQMTDQDWISYKDRWRNFGEEAAARWLLGKYGPQEP